MLDPMGLRGSADCGLHFVEIERRILDYSNYGIAAAMLVSGVCES